MSEYSVRLTARQAVAEGTMAFSFEKPAGFAYKPGQAMDLILPGPHADPNSSDARHAFSIVSAPHQGELTVATRMRDSIFKRTLGKLANGTTVTIDGPFGSLTLHKNTARAAVLIAGGIGVTPFMSMLRHAARQQLQQDLLLLYSNRRPEDAAFLGELQQLEKENPRFRLLATMTDMAHSTQAWGGASGKFDGAWIKQAIAGLAEPVFYVSGPPALVAAMCQALTDAGVDEDEVRSEEFHGY
ncbi:ferredoxin--NADP reductase [Vogesella sp. LIG4]|uniref:ferredoxin--NADP reductase n=1 Tax=Vogesella sp. LIG4 TaxID=1192162 RepID=UPI00081F82F5|nr:FAD-dependent oxidoreductase [Vogesella sp. LIG4]SCK24717.1 Ferredoxin-NADP reductase [Vogesella sp. LIG4]